MLLWNRAVLIAGSTRVSLLLYLEPAVSVLGALVFLREQVTLATIAGGLLIVAGVAASTTGTLPLCRHRLRLAPRSRGPH